MKELERLSALELIDLYYGDESRVSMEPCIPYGWQFKDEDVFIPSEKGKGLILFGLLSRDNRLIFRTTKGKVDSSFVIEQLETLAFTIKKMTVIVLDNARIHTSAKVQACREAWEQRGLFIFYLPAYSPHLVLDKTAPPGPVRNLIETLWRKLKYQWLRPQDYASEESLFYLVTQILAAVGRDLTINLASSELAQTNCGGVLTS